MDEAVRLDHADTNPLVSLKVHRDKPAKKPEITDAEIIKIRDALKEEPEWMQVLPDATPLTPIKRWWRFRKGGRIGVLFYQ